MVEGEERDAIREVAEEVRRALELMNRDDFPSLRDFPRGSCGDASTFLGEVLFESGLGEWTYRHGIDRKQNYRSHAWIERHGVIVDITADQFLEVDESVIVTTSSSWHDSFHQGVPHPARLVAWGDEPHLLYIREAYDRVLGRLGDSRNEPLDPRRG